MSVRCLSPLFVLLVVLIGAVSGATDLKRKVGDEVSFKPNPTLSSGNTITWKFKGPGKVIRVIEFDHGESGSAQNPLFKDNTAADKITGELTLKNLRKDHSGLYYFEINGKEQEHKFTLMVMGVVLKPKINQEKSSNHDVVYLTCEYNKTINDNAKMSWNCSNVKQNQTTENSFTYSTTGKADSCCTCTLKNDVSEETSGQICETEMFPGGSNIKGIVLGSIIAIIVLIVLSCLLYKYRNKVHNWIHSNCKDKPCLGVMVERLEGLRSKKDRQREEEDKSISESLKKTDTGAGDQCAGDKGAGDECAGDKGAGDKGAGDECAGDKGAGDKCAGDECAGDKGAGDKCAGDECAGDKGAGDECAGDKGAGDKCAGDECAGDKGAGDECAGDKCPGVNDS